MYGESNMETYITIYKIDSQWEIAGMAQETQTGALYQPRGMGWGRSLEGFSKGRGYMYTCGYNGTPLQYSCLKNPMDRGA